MYHDDAPRYAPAEGFCRCIMQPVRRWVAHPPGNHPHSPIKDDCTALELVFDNGSRWYGFDRVWINSELRMIVSGYDTRHEEIQGWAIVPEPLRDDPKVRNYLSTGEYTTRTAPQR